MNLHKHFAVCGIAAALSMLLTAPIPAQAAIRHSHLPTPARYVPRGKAKKRVSLNVDHAPIRTVLRLLFRRGNQSYVLGPGVYGTVTASLHNVPFDTALTQILSANSHPLTKTMKKMIYVIKGRHLSRHNRFRKHFYHGRTHG